METIFRPTKRGTVFKSETGKLYLFEPGSITVLSAPWPKPCAWKKTRSNIRWTHVRPKITIPCRDVEGRIERLSAPPADKNGQLLFPFCASPEEERERRGDIAWLRWSAMIPKPVLEILSHFPNRQWAILSFLARCGEAAMDLALANPALAWATACNWAFHQPRVQRPLRSARALLKSGKKQRDILGWLGFPATEAGRKTLRKVIHETIDVSALLYLRQSMNDSVVMKALAHVPRINRGVIRVVSDPELFPLVSPPLLEEISFSRDNDKRPKTAWLLQDSLNMARLLRVGQGRFPHLKSLARLAEFHDSMIEDMGYVRLQDIDFAFPPPPVKGTDTIIPLTTATDLIEEGRVQKNCVAGLCERVAIQRDIYIYQTLFPERCTLSIIKRGNGVWVLQSLKRACNIEPAEATRCAVLKWLAESQPEDVIPGRVEVENDEWVREQDEYRVADNEPLPEPHNDGIPF